MRSIELNKMLIDSFPNLINDYQEEVEWQEGDETGSHTVYGDVFTPYVVKCIENKEFDELNAIFEFLELLLSKEDPYVEEVVAFSVIESIEYLLKENEETIYNKIGKRTKELLVEVKN